MQEFIIYYGILLHRLHLVDGGNLVIQDARQTDAGRYQCIARNAAGSRESAIATLKIHSKLHKLNPTNFRCKYSVTNVTMLN